MYAHTKGKVFQIGGFTPWAWKYTSEGQAGGKHGGVDTEWKYAQMVSAYLGVMDADALGLSGMSNASFYQHYPLKKRYPQSAKPSEADLRARGLLDEAGRVAPRMYVCFYMGDYDSAAWLNTHVPLWWNDPAHGAIPCAWAFNPNLDQRAPHVFDYVRTHQTPNDWFLFGDSGAGYLNPGMLAETDGWDAWVAHNQPYAERYDLSITGFVIDGHSPGMGEVGMDAYQRFSPDGIVGQKIPARGVHRGVMPYLRMALDLHGDPEDAGDHVAGLVGVNAPKFLFIRTILKSPSWHQAVMDRARARNAAIEFVDPYTFFALLKRDVLVPAAPAATGTLPVLRFTPPDGRAGLAPIAVGDGPFGFGSRDGVPVITQAKPETTQYLYFEVDNALTRALAVEARAVRVEVRVFDDVPGTLGIHYDSREHGPYHDGPVVELHGGGAWRTVAFDLPEAHLAHGQNGGADFRLVNFGNDLRIACVTLRTLD